MKIKDQLQRGVRPAAVAGRFYPANPAELKETVLGFLADISPEPGTPPKALIVPHAGYIYSGPIAASAYAGWRPARASIRRVVLVGPSHWVGFEGLVTASDRAFATPLGDVPVDRQAVDSLKTLPQVHLDDEPHRQEHALEVQLPFLQCVLSDFQIVPLLVGQADPGSVSEVLEALWGGPETGIVISSDLSHYHSYAVARDWDRQTADAIESLDPHRLSSSQACGGHAIRGLLVAASRHHLAVKTLDLRNSGDTAGSQGQVVGYGAFAFQPV